MKWYKLVSDSIEQPREGIMTDQTATVTCKFPGCANPPEPASDKPGRRPEYCADPGITR